MNKFCKTDVRLNC